MNKNLHRIIFNAVRGMRMVVQETARSVGKSNTSAGGIGVALSALLGVASAQGQIIGAPNVPGNQRPTVLVAPNAVPVVNIQTPSAAGVSRNVYSRFDIERNGVILNNSRTNAQTQLGGWVQGNPWLATGPARVILNEINSGNPSQLRGFAEVAGQRAEVVIANPAGIVVDGGGFLNASRVTLTTGVPQLNAMGGLDSFRVGGGNISIDGQGLDLSQTDYAAIYARAMQVNAGIWANDLTVATGANQISAEHGEIIPIAGSGGAPAFALDVAALGGMFANKIRLIGTEAGLGVRNAGNIGAGAGGLVVTAAGRLENTGTLEGSRVELASAGDITNAGTIRQTSMAALTLAAPTLVNTNGGTIGHEPIADSSGAGAGSGPSGSSSGAGADTGGAGAGSSAGASGDPSAGAVGGGTAAAPAAPVAPGVISAAGTIRNDGGRIYAGGPIELQTPNVSNAGGKLEVSNLSVTGPAFSNAGGTLQVTNGFQANVSSFDNSAGGKLSAGRVDIATTGDLNNQDGTIESAGDATFAVAGSVNNTRGAISAAGSFTADVSGAIQNSSGSLLANQAVSIRGQSLDNTLGTVASAAAGTSLSVATTVTNSGRIGAATDLAVRAGSMSNSGSLRAGNDAEVVAANALTNDGSVTAARNVTITADSVQGGSTGVLGAGVQSDNSLGATGDLHVKTTGALVAQGTNVAAGEAVLQGASVDLLASKTNAANIAITAINGNVITSGATVATAGALSVSAQALAGATLVNDAGKLNAGQLDLRASNLTNSNGGEIVQTGTGAARIAVAGVIDNTAGSIASNGDATIQAGSFGNDGGRIASAGSISSTTSGATSNQGGAIVANGNVDLAADSLNNQNGSISAVGDTTLVVAKANNAAGLIASGGTLSLSDQSGGSLKLDNIGGRLVGVSDVNLGIGESIGAGSGKVLSDGDIHLRGAAGWTNSEVIQSGGNISYDFAGTLTNKGTMSAGETLSGKSHDLVNSAGASMSGHRVEINAQGTLTNSGAIEATDTLIAKGVNIVNGSTGLLSSGNHTYLLADGSLTNNGTIDGEDTQVRGGSITNTSRIYGTWLSVGDGASVVNEAGAVIAARGYLDVGATSIVNRGELLSEGGMTIAGELDDDGIATGKAAVLRNESALISANESMTLRAADIQNIDTHLTVERVTTVLPARSIITVAGIVLPEGTEAMVAGPPGTPEGRYLLVKQSDGTWVRMGPGYSIQVIELTVEEDQARNAQAAHILAGGDIEVDGRLTNRDSQVLAGGTFSASMPVVNEPTPGERRESGTSTYLAVGINPNTSGDVPLTVTPINNQPTTYALTSWGAPGGGGAAVNNQTPGASGGGNAPGGGAGDPNLGGGGAGEPNFGGGGSRPIVEVPGAGSLVVRTAPASAALPGSSLFNLRPHGNGYLVETDPRYASYRQWLSSDYLLNNLGLDPRNMLKRLGDGHYEQRLIREQVAQLTGSRYLEGFGSDEEQYTALMNAGATFAQKFQLTPGIALTAEQMAQLTSDIVWLVEQTVTLPDGSTQRVLVPQVYVRVRPGDIDGNGTLLSADKVRINGAEGAGDIVNRGTIAGRSVVELNADNVRNLDGGRITGGSVKLDARQDIDNIGSTIDARNSLSLNAGRDVNVVTTTTTRQTALAESSTTIDRVAGLYVTGPGGTLQVDAGRDINLTGAVVSNRDSANPASGSGLTRLNAGRDLNLDTVTEPRTRTDVLAGGFQYNSSSRETGTVIATNGTTILGAGQDINARQADVDAGSGLLVANAGRNLNIVDGQANDSSDYLYQSTKKGTFSNTTTTITASQESSTSVGSSFQGGLVSLHADNNVNIVGSHVNGTQGVSITAGNELNIVEGRDTHSSSAGLSRTKSFEFLDRHLSQEKKVGNTLETRTDDAAASTITSGQGGIYLEGGNSVYLRGAQVNAAKDLTIQGGEVTIIAARNEAGLTVGNSSSKKSGVSSALHGLDRKNENIRDADVSSLANSTLSGANVSITATGDNGTSGAVTIAGTTIDTPGKLKLEGDSVNLALQSTESTTSRTGGSSNLTWQSTKDSGTTDETLHYNQINAGSLEVNADRVTVGMNAKDSVDALAQQPGMGWIGQMNSDPNLAGKVDWQTIEEAHRNWDYGKSGLTPEGAAVVTVVVTYLTWGAASGIGAAASGAVGGGTTGLVVSGAVTAGVSALASQASVALINNTGDLGKTFDDLGSSSSVKNLLTAVVTGGVLGGLNLNPTGLPTTGGGASEFMNQLGKNLTAGAAKAVISTAINGGSLEDALKDGLRNALLDTAAAQGANWIGKNTDLGSFTNYAAHAIAGCAAGAGRSGVSSGGGCAAGAVGAALGEAAAIFYNRDRSPEDILLNGMYPDTTQFAAMISSIGVAIGGGDANEINLGANAGANAAANNFRNLVVVEAMEACITSAKCMALIGISALAVDALPGRIAELRAQNEGMSERAANAVALSEMLADALLGRNTTTSGSTEPKKPLGPTVLPTPEQASQEYGPPPLESPRAMQRWLGNVLEGIPLDQAQAWAKDFVTTLPVAEQQSMGDFIMLSVQQNTTKTQQARTNELTQLFDKQSPGAESLTLDRPYRATPEGNKRGTVKVFDTTNLSNAQLESEVRTYVNGLTGGAQLTPKGNPPSVWTTQLSDGTVVNLRSVSSSQIGSTGFSARWTVDIQDNPSLIGLNENFSRNEIKFK
ncbi:DUF637 domain-containing protein [Variovorax sp. J22P240]|uniref:two-partner secretion domain-containing protein n=1 Tax=Variovorax sp. J22P240 TaxID=3053514 RepID=UPI0025779BB2|nr:DUF637 domain-containing protein [Variovorax sp. J22P240]MDL9998621.1 DUF637 domain-containing protein [Variovorax sp. J22P240]